MSYQKDAAYNLFVRPGAEVFGYSEGVEAERRLLDIVESIRDRSTFSTEYLDKIVDWSTRYHFSRARHCLLRPLDILPGERVLELGCGTGAITRYLGEIGAEITAVEGSLARARVAAARCHDLPNVTVIADDLQAVDVQGQYDWVTLIGVLEYAGAYSCADDPYREYLASAIRHLKPGGRVVIAIENQLGLKYFNGCGEDHLGKPFAGIQDLYAGQGGVRTFGRKALSSLLERAGLMQQQWLYPYPDYKVPSVVLTEAALGDPDFNSVDLLLRSFSEDYSGNNLRLFDEALVNRVLADNGLLADFSNSFLVVAQCGADAPLSGLGSIPAQVARVQTSGIQAISSTARTSSDTGPLHDEAAEGPMAGARGADGWQPMALAWSFAVNRQAGMCTETRFLPVSKGAVNVSKRRLLPEAPRCVRFLNDQTICAQPTDSAHISGWQWAWPLLHVQARLGTVPELVDALFPWTQYLLKQATDGGPSSVDQASKQPQEGAEAMLRHLTLPGNLLDLLPFNIMEDAQGRLHVIDQEWVVSSHVPAGWVLTRGVLHVLRMGVVSPCLLKSLTRIVLLLAERNAVRATREDVETWLGLEGAFQSVVGARPLENAQDTLLSRPARLMQDVVNELTAEVARLHEQLRLAEHEREHLVARAADEHQQLVDSLSSISQGQVRIQMLEREVQELLASRSWRWSSWLRGLRRRVRV